jgi:hypothetical protein
MTEEIATEVKTPTINSDNVDEVIDSIEAQEAYKDFLSN